MKRRKSSIILGAVAVALTAVVILVFVLRFPPPLNGTWISTVSYQSSEPGSVGLVIEEDGRVRVTTDSASPLWWSIRYELHLRGTW